MMSIVAKSGVIILFTLAAIGFILESRAVMHPADNPATSQSDQDRNETRTSDRQNEQDSDRNRGATTETRDANQNARNQQRPGSTVTAEREAAALTFVEQHHPAVTQLLQFLKKNRPSDYERAIRELFRKSEQLAAIHERGDLERYDLELNIWKTESRARLIAAHIARQDSEDLRQRLEQVLAQHYRYKRELIAKDRDRVSDRLGRMNDNLEQIDANFDSIVDREMQSLVRKMQQSVSGRRRGDAQTNRGNDADTNQRP